jgi:HK97 family phage portal protein
MISRAGRHFLASTNNPDQWLIDWVRQGEPTSSGEAITEENALHCPAVKACVSMISESLALSSIEVCRQKTPDAIEVVKDHPLTAIFNRAPNPETNAMCWWDTLQNHHGTYGNAYAYIQRTVRGNTFALWNRSPKPERTKPVRSEKDGQLYYECHNAKGSLEGFIPAADMLHVKYMSMDGISGKSPVRMIREAIGGNKAAERFANEVFKNGMDIQGHYTHPARISEAAQARLEKSLNRYAEHGERHRNLLLEEGMQFKSESHNFTELQMLEARQYLDVVVASAYNLDAQLVQMRVNGVSPFPDLVRKFVSFTLALWGERWTAEINSKLLTPPFFARWNFSVFTRNDRQAQSQEHRTNFSVGKQSVNEMRHERGDNRLEIPEADEHYVPMNMVPLSLANQVAQALIDKAKLPTQNPKGGDNREAPPGMPSGGGDGQTPADPNDPDGGRPEKQPGELATQAAGFPDISREIHNGPLALLEAEALLAENLQRFERIEANAVLRFAKFPPEFQAKLDEFYAKHVERLREELLQPVRLVVLLREGQLGSGISADIELDNTINEHLGGKRESLLTAADGCPPQDLPARVAAVVEGWGHGRDENHDNS